MERVYKKVSESEIILTELMLPSHSNFSGKIHGGFILSLMDKAAYSSSAKFSGEYCVTASVNRVDFLSPIEVGELVTLRAQVNYVGNTSMVIGIRVESQDIHSGIVKHCNSSYFTMIAKDEAGKTVQVPGLIIEDLNQMRRFLRSISHLEDRRERKDTFDRNNFVPENYAGVLDKYPVKLEIE